MRIAKDTAWALFAAGAAMLAAMAVRQGLNQAWRLAKHEDPPLDPGSSDVAWRDAIIWTVASGAVAGLGRLVARRGAAAGWQRITGEAPPV